MSAQPGLHGSDDLRIRRKMVTFQLFFQSGRAKDLSARLYKYPRHPTSDPHQHGNINDSVRFGVLTAMLVKIRVSAT